MSNLGRDKNFRIVFHCHDCIIILGRNLLMPRTLSNNFEIYVLMITQRLGGWDPVKRFNHICWVAVVTPIDNPDSVRNRCVIEVLGSEFVLSLWVIFGFSVGIEAIVIEPNKISSFFS